jgi:secreted trypsin-like serine protease
VKVSWDNILQPQMFKLPIEYIELQAAEAWQQHQPHKTLFCFCASACSNANSCTVLCISVANFENVNDRVTQGPAESKRYRYERQLGAWTHASSSTTTTTMATTTTGTTLVRLELYPALVPP